MTRSREEVQSELDQLRHTMRHFMGTWRKAVELERWLEGEVWEEMPYEDLRHDWDDEGRFFWLFPDYAEGRSHVLGVTGDVLRNEKPEDLRKFLTDLGWRRRISKASTLVHYDEAGKLAASDWSPEIDEAWFPDPAGGYYCARPESSRAMYYIGPPFLGLQGRTWSAMGPENPAPVRSYSAEDLRNYVPRGTATPE